MTEIEYEKLLNIKSSGDQLGFNQSLHLNRYEPTLYEHLDLLLSRYEIKQTDCIVDFGCGKGRLNFYLAHFTSASVVGIEINEQFFQDALKNKQNYEQKHRKSSSELLFHCCLAQNYDIQPSENKFYFFNPFSVQIFMKVIDNIISSIANHPRIVDLILYYPSSEYTYYLESLYTFILVDEIVLPRYNKDPRERFTIYRYTPSQS